MAASATETRETLESNYKSSSRIHDRRVRNTKVSGNGDRMLAGRPLITVKWGTCRLCETMAALKTVPYSHSPNKQLPKH